MSLFESWDLLLFFGEIGVVGDCKEEIDATGESFESNASEFANFDWIFCTLVVSSS